MSQIAGATRHVYENHRDETRMGVIMSDNILVIGSGFAGFWAAVAARRVAGSHAQVTLVSREPMLEIRRRLYEAKPETLATHTCRRCPGTLHVHAQPLYHEPIEPPDILK